MNCIFNDCQYYEGVYKRFSTTGEPLVVLCSKSPMTIAEKDNLIGICFANNCLKDD